jgi:integrase
MIKLHQGCSATEPAVSPANWDKKGASTEKDWFVWYRFIDPDLTTKYPDGKLVVVKGMNKHKGLEDRRKVTREILKEVKHLLREVGFNPARNSIRESVPASLSEISPNTGLSLALDMVMNVVKAAPNTLNTMKGSLRFMQTAIGKLDLYNYPVGKITPKHIRLIFDTCRKIKTCWSAQTYNHYRAYLLILFNQLVELQAIDINPVCTIKRQPILKKIKEAIPLEARIRIDQHFAAIKPNYRRFIQAFFYSGARPVELLRLKASDVNLKEGWFKIVVRKGKQPQEVRKPIMESALHLWMELIDECEKVQAKAVDTFVFGKGLKPGSHPHSRDHISHVWHREVKEKLELDYDLYQVKHTALDETARELGVKSAQGLASHSTPVITMKHYLPGEREREMDRLRKLKVKFAE